ncbi:MAG: hypothetical protein HKO82_10655 [Acidimicrobiia bacterium]|nr:hypothetical protein [Acidimicrobiia bacterium]
MRRNWSISALLVMGALVAASCGTDAADTVTSTLPSTTTSTTLPLVTGESGGAACQYTNPFTGDSECRRYVGEGWSDASRADDCAAPFSSVEGTLVSNGCELEDSVGTCRIEAGQPGETLTFYYGGDTAMLSQFCANPGGGVWADSGESAGAPSSMGDDVPPEAAAAAIGTATVAVKPECTDASCIASVVEARGAVEFTPRSQAPRTGLILFPGASVDIRAYAPLAHLIADSGHFVALVPVPGGVSLGNEDRVDDVVAAHPEINTWFVGGHSLGGVAAATYAANERAESIVSGLVLWASYLDEMADLPDIELAVTSIYGSEDGLTTVAEVEANRGYLPAETRYVAIEGGNHAQFGFYGTQDGDGAPLISPEAQAQLAAKATAHFMASIEAGLLQAPDARYAAAADLEGSWCERSQEIMANLASGLPEVSVDEFRAENEFVESKPLVDDEGVVHVPMHPFQIGQHTVLDAPPILTGELWCKHKSQDFFAAQGATPAGDPGSCAKANRAAWEWALTQLTEAERRFWESSGREVEFALDIDHDAGPAWLAGAVDVVRDGPTVTISSSRLVVAADADLDDPRNTGLAYCKLWTPADALRLALNP